MRRCQTAGCRPGGVTMHLRTIFVLAAALAMAGTALAAPPEPEEDASYQLPVVVHGKTSMRQAMRSGSTFSFKMFQQEGRATRQPYSYPEPDSNR